MEYFDKAYFDLDDKKREIINEILSIRLSVPNPKKIAEAKKSYIEKLFITKKGDVILEGKIYSLTDKDKTLANLLSSRMKKYRDEGVKYFVSVKLENESAIQYVSQMKETLFLLELRYSILKKVKT